MSPRGSSAPQLWSPASSKHPPQKTPNPGTPPGYLGRAPPPRAPAGWGRSGGAASSGSAGAAQFLRSSSPPAPSCRSASSSLPPPPPPFPGPVEARGRSGNGAGPGLHTVQLGSGSFAVSIGATWITQRCWESKGITVEQMKHYLGHTGVEDLPKYIRYGQEAVEYKGSTTKSCPQVLHLHCTHMSCLLLPALALQLLLRGHEGLAKPLSRHHGQV
ncbi:multiple C2 and transmembrane domain-containing protein 1-like [Prinia subflava]|uniref:multiple C2 and transmembrane domain-containing protein 1-like n=1 Tax=Prinia subflava TaxID=208062 RepID=UPI002FE0A938